MNSPRRGGRAVGLAIVFLVAAVGMGFVFPHLLWVKVVMIAVVLGVMAWLLVLHGQEAGERRVVRWLRGRGKEPRNESLNGK